MLFSLKSRKKEDRKTEEKSKFHEEKRKNSKMDEFGDDLDFNESPVRRSDTRLERKQDVSHEFISDFPNEYGEVSMQAPHRTRKTAGWADSTPGKKSWLRRGSMNFLKGDSPKKEIMDTSPINSDIPVIPDLDSMKDEELSADIAKAPSLAVSRIATFQELDNDLFISKHAAFQSLDGIDLGHLTKRLLPEHLVKKEHETPWTWDTLFADVSSHLNSAMSTNQNDASVVDKISDHLDKVL